MTFAYSTRGYGHDTAPVDLHCHKVIIEHLGVAPVDLPVGSTAAIRWKMEQLGLISWGQIGILAGAAPGFGAAPLRWVGVLDTTEAWRTVVPGVHVMSEATLDAAVAAGEDLYVSFAIWAPGITTGTGHVIPSSVTVRLTGSAWADPIAAGYVGEVATDGWKPYVGQPVAMDVFQATAPVAAVVTFAPLLPPPPPPPPDPEPTSVEI